MKTKKQIAILLLAALFASITCACKPTDDAPPVVSKTSTVSASSNAAPHIKQTFFNGLSIDADVTVPKGVDTKAVKIQKVAAVPFQKESVLQTLFKNTKIKTHQSQYQGATRGGNKSPIEIYTAEDESSLNLDSAMGNLSYSSPLADAISYAYFDSSDSFIGKSNRNLYKKKDLSWMTSQQAVKKAQDILTQFGVPPLPQPEMVALDHETLQAQEVDPQKYKVKDTDKTQKKGTWTEADECYVLYFHQKVNGIPVGSEKLFQLSNPPQILMYLGKNGVVKLDMFAYMPTNGVEETKPIIPAEQAVRSFAALYGSALLPSPLKVTKIDLAYELNLTDAHSDVYQFSPTWVFTMMSKSDDKSEDMVSTACVDALTGKLIRE